MNSPAILYPMFALAGLTLFVQALIPVARLGSGRRGEIRTTDFKYGESSAAPAQVSIPNRNYMNLLEFPVLLYVGCLLAYVATDVSPLMVVLAWAFVGLRVVHSAIHLTYNRVVHRALIFAVSNVVLVVLWVQVAVQVASRAGA
jgi:hypothetical protein